MVRTRRQDGTIIKPSLFLNELFPKNECYGLDSNFFNNENKPCWLSPF